MPMQPTTVPGTIDFVNVSNTSVITQTANKITDEQAATDKALADAVAKAVAASAEKAGTDIATEIAKTAEKEKLQLPLKAGSYSYVSDYGLRCAPVSGAGNFHTGMDLAAPLGTPMYSIADGTVVSVTDGSGSTGGDVRIESTVNGKLMTFRYHHMGKSSQYVKVGDQIKAGHHISDVASTGMSTGPHLHLEVFEGKFSAQKHIDPEIYFKEIGLEVVAKASANTVNKNDHPASCPGGTFTIDSSLPISASSSVPSQPSAPVTPVAPPAAPSAPPAAPKPTPAPVVTPTPTPSAKPSPSPVPTLVPTPTPVPTSIPQVTPSAIPTVTVTIQASGN